MKGILVQQFNDTVSVSIVFDDGLRPTPQPENIKVLEMVHLSPDEVKALIIVLNKALTCAQAESPTSFGPLN